MSATMTLKLAEPRETLLDAAIRLMRDDVRDPAEMLDRLVRIRGFEGAVRDVIDGLILVAEQDGSPPEDCDATIAILEAIKDRSPFLSRRS